MKLRRVIYLGGAVLIILVVFTFDVIRKSVALEVGGLSTIRDVVILGAFVLVYLFLESRASSRSQTPIRTLGSVMVATLIMVVFGIGLATMGASNFDSKNDILIPIDYATIFVASLAGVTFGTFAVVTFRSLRDLVMFKRKKATRRNLLSFIAFTIAASGSTLWLNPLEENLVTTLLLALAVIGAIVNSFRLSWIVYLTKREKIFSLIYAFFLLIGFIVLDFLISQNVAINQALLYHSYPVKGFVSMVCLFGSTYFGMAFISTLFHLPTAEAFDRKTSEISSLHNLGRLVTQVFDFSELVDTVTSMTLQVCEARSSWLEIIHHDERNSAGPAQDSAGRPYAVQIASKQNISQEEIERVLSLRERTLRDTVVEGRKTIVIDDVAHNVHFRHVRKEKIPIGSMVIAPLVSHNVVMGILYATKSVEYGFFKDDVDVISAFADQATIAIENSRLIKKSIERERLMRELVLAQEMQRRLLPQVLPHMPGLQIDALSTPAFEVGGDYYDIVQLDDHRLGIVVGDVSGKGVSAAFYMSQVKGIFQAISKMYPSPREFMIHANDALLTSIDKRSFVSLIYAVIDSASGILILSRAGHCPMLHVSGETVRFIRPSGMGMGLRGGDLFAGALEETSLQLALGDVCIFYTDGITEARRGEEEFGYDRLLLAAQQSRTGSASMVKDHILDTVRSFTDHEASHDDLTVVVVKWLGHGTTTKNTN